MQAVVQRRGLLEFQGHIAPQYQQIVGANPQDVAAVALAKMGARIVLVARDKSRGDATLLGFATAPQTSLTPYILPICYAWPR